MEDRRSYILLRRFDGRIEEALLLSLGSNSMRVSIAGEGDAVTLRDGQWISDKNDVVEVEFMAAAAEDELNSFLERLALDEIDAWAAKPLPLGCVPAPAAGTLWN